METEYSSNSSFLILPTRLFPQMLIEEIGNFARIGIVEVSSFPL